MPSALADYLRAIRLIPLLTPAEELLLAARIQRWVQQDEPTPAECLRGRRAFHRMVTANLRLVVSLCQRQQRRQAVPGIDLLDLVQAGNLGLIKAVRRFDHRRGYRFSTYGTWWINQAINAHLHDLSCPIRLPERLSELAGQALALQSRSPQPLSCDHLARQLGTTPARLARVLDLHRQLRPLSLDRPSEAGDSETTLLERVEDERSNLPQETYQWLHDQLQLLGARERAVLSLRYLQEQRPSLERIAERTGLTRSQIVHCEQRALRQLRLRFQAPCA